MLIERMDGRNFVEPADETSGNPGGVFAAAAETGVGSATLGLMASSFLVGFNDVLNGYVFAMTSVRRFSTMFFPVE